jgi:hypothetical protein
VRTRAVAAHWRFADVDRRGGRAYELNIGSTRQRLTPQKPLWLLLAAVGVAVFVLFVVLFVNALNPYGGWNEATGRVVDIHRSGDDRDTTIRFTDTDGIEYRFRSEHSGSIGDSVTVKYPPRDPASAKTSADVWQDRVVSFMFGVGSGWLAVWATG